VTSKLQVTIPKAIADRYSISPGDELEWIAGVDSVRIVPVSALASSKDTDARIRWFDAFQHDRLYGTVRIINPFV